MKTISQSLANEWYPFVQKSQIDGYDGQGVVVIRGEAQLENQLNTPSLLEKLINIESKFPIKQIGERVFQIGNIF